MSLLRSLRQYSVFDLFNIALHKAILKIALSIEKRTISSRNKQLHKCHCLPNISKSNVHSLLAAYESLLCPDIPKANRIVNTREIEIFNKWYKKGPWLQDPIFGQNWPTNEFFQSSRTKIQGYGDVKFVLEINKLNHLVTVATAFHKTKQQHYIDYIGNEIKSWWHEIPYERSVVYKIVMDTAFRAINLISISILCFDNKKFRSEIYPLIYDILSLSERQIHKFSTPKWYKTGNGANHVIGEMVGAIVIKLWKFISSNNSHDVLPKMQTEYKWLYATCDKLISKTGVYLEQSANYSRLVCEFLLMLDIFETAAGMHTKTRIYFKKLSDYVLTLANIDQSINFGDNDGASVLIAFKNNISDLSPIEKYREAILDDPKLLDYKQYNQDGHFIWKSNDSKAISLFIRHGTFCHFREGAAAHAHCDLLAILMSVNGESLFIDRGCYLYNTDANRRFEDVSTLSHNTVTINNQEQAIFDGRGYYDYPKTTFLPTDIHDSCIFSACISYQENTHARKIFYQKNELQIVDSIKSNANANYTILFLLSDKYTPIATKNKDSINICQNDKIKAIVKFLNIDTIYCSKEYYYPIYANKKETYAIRGQGTLRNGMIDIITKISFL